jgi:hypothetical protein
MMHNQWDMATSGDCGERGLGNFMSLQVQA